jgi:3-hydroxyacyl-CoA dehydrogenase
MIDDYRAEHGITPRKISRRRDRRALHLRAGQRRRAHPGRRHCRARVDIDVVYLNGYGFPLHRGGPMLYADTVGLGNVVRALRRFAAEPGADPSWQPAPLLVSLAEQGKTFN